MVEEKINSKKLSKGIKDYFSILSNLNLFKSLILLSSSLLIFLIEDISPVLKEYTILLLIPIIILLPPIISYLDRSISFYIIDCISILILVVHFWFSEYYHLDSQIIISVLLGFVIVLLIIYIYKAKIRSELKLDYFKLWLISNFWCVYSVAIFFKIILQRINWIFWVILIIIIGLWIGSLFWYKYKKQLNGNYITILFLTVIFIVIFFGINVLL